MLLIGLSLAAAVPIQETAPRPPVPAATTTPMLCRVAANKVAVLVLMGRAMVRRLDEKGVQGAEKARRDALAKSLDENEARVLRIDARYPELKPTVADNAAFDAMKPEQQKALLIACAEAA